MLVDGVPRSFNNINVNDIASFTILEDALATAVYGVRGANGVILIHTKQGSPGKPQVHFRYNEGVTSFTRLPNFANGVEYMKAANEAKTNRGEKIVYHPDAIKKTAEQTDPYLYPDVDWYQAIFKPYGHIRQAHLDVSGGSKNVTYYVSASYLDNIGQFESSKFVKQYDNQISNNRYNSVANLRMHITNTTKLTFGINGYLNIGHFPGYGRDRIYNDAYYATPISFPKVFPDGKVPNFDPGNFLHNPYADLTRTGYRTYHQNDIKSNIKLTQNLSFLIPGLSVNTMFAYDAYNSISKRRTKTPDSYTAAGRDTTTGKLILQQVYSGQQFLGYDKVNHGRRHIYTRSQLNYRHDFGRNSVGAMFLYKQSDLSYSDANSFIASLPHRYRGFSGSVRYGYNNTYFVKFAAGYNGSENFAPSNRYGFFPSFGVNWVVSSEPFFKPLKNIFQFLRFRFSYGKVGSSKIAGRRFAYLATVNTGASGYLYGSNLHNNIGGVAVGEFASQVSWETSKR